MYTQYVRKEVESSSHICSRLKPDSSRTSTSTAIITAADGKVAV